MSIAWIWSGRTAAFKNDAEYVAARAFLCGDKELQPGETIDKTAVSVRRLRQLHDQRYVALKSRWDEYWGAKPEEVVAAALPKPKPKPAPAPAPAQEPKRPTLQVPTPKGAPVAAQQGAEHK